MCNSHRSAQLLCLILIDYTIIKLLVKILHKNWTRTGQSFIEFIVQYLGRFFQDVILIQLINNVRITQSDKINLKIDSCVKKF